LIGTQRDQSKGQGEGNTAAHDFHDGSGAQERWLFSQDHDEHILQR